MIRVQADAFDAGAEIAALTEGRHHVGGVCVFIGLVRDFAGDGDVAAMTLEHYPEMTERQLGRIDDEAHRRWPLDRTLVIHRHGRLSPGDAIVLVAATSAHRDAAFDACRFLIDWLKTKAPFWKAEEGSAGRRWVEASGDDEARAGRWSDGTATSR